jgi:hypothetical protein
VYRKGCIHQTEETRGENGIGKILTLLMVAIWVVGLCSILAVYKRFGGKQNPENGGSKLLRNVGVHSN